MDQRFSVNNNDILWGSWYNCFIYVPLPWSQTADLEVLFIKDLFDWNFNFLSTLEYSQNSNFPKNCKASCLYYEILNSIVVVNVVNKNSHTFYTVNFVDLLDGMNIKRLVWWKCSLWTIIDVDYSYMLRFVTNISNVSQGNICTLYVS